MTKSRLVLSLMLTFVGCSSKTTVKETDAFRFDSKTGYAYSTAPFGIDTTELESAIGSKLTMVSESPATALSSGIYELFIEGHRSPAGPIPANLMRSLI